MSYHRADKVITQLHRAATHRKASKAYSKDVSRDVRLRYNLYDLNMLIVEYICLRVLYVMFTIILRKRQMTKTNVLHLLAASNNPTALDAVENLLKTRQKRVNEREEEGLTALHVAAAWDNLAMCQLLMYFGADPFQADDNGRTAKSMAKGSVKKFFERLYETKTPGKSRSVQQSFLRALNLLFSCATKKAIKTPPQLNRSYSWSPSYNGTDNFLSEEERRLRWAFRKNQPGFSDRKAEKEKRLISPIGKKSSEQASGLINFSSQKPTLSTVGPSKPESDDSATYVTAPEYNIRSGHNLPYNRNSNNASPCILSEEFTSLELDSTSSRTKDCVTNEFSSENSSMGVLAEILAVVHLNNFRGECVGPLLETTRPAYELRLARLIANLPSSVPKLKYSWALECWIAGNSFSEGPKLDRILINSFAGFSGEQLREGNRPTSFCYILIDPSVICPSSSSCTMQQFVDSIFYIGKGKRSRPFRHLVDAVRAKGFGDGVLSKSEKLRKIVDLWDAGHGVVSLHVFQNTIPSEAYTREAAMIDAIGLRNLTNVKRGDYYGPTKNWTMKEKTVYGSYLLFNALSIFHVEGCRKIYEDDVQER
uniref:ANK_REP_REGION domain-containing protein n=1 Tax=Elaeophora elaphi TaxID=1147741 RepID=A0A0R3RZ36_9BILA